MSLRSIISKILLFTIEISLAIAIIFIGVSTYKQHIITQSFTQNNGDYIILLHGLGRTAASMRDIGYTLAKNNYRVTNINYPSTEHTIEWLAEKHLQPKITALDTNTPVHIITHSMGGVITRYYLANNTIDNLGSVIQLAPPNQGSEAADLWNKNIKKQTLLGPALPQMTSNPDSLVSTLPPPNYTLGIIAGKYDKKVSIEKTKITNMTDFLLTRNTHTFIMNDTVVIDAIQHFIKQGHF